MYVRYERIRNYILRLRYEWDAPKWLAEYRAISRYKIGEEEIKRAIYEWKNWYYDNGVRHRPIELFIEDEKKKEAIKINYTFHN